MLSRLHYRPLISFIRGNSRPHVAARKRTLREHTKVRLPPRRYRLVLQQLHLDPTVSWNLNL